MTGRLRDSLFAMRTEIVQRVLLAIGIVTFWAVIGNGHRYGDVHFVLSFSRRLHFQLANREPHSVYYLFRNPLDVQFGRIWPFARPYFLGIYELFGFDIIAWSWWNCMVVLLAVQLFYTLCWMLCAHRRASIIASILLLMFSPMWYSVFRQHWLEIPMMLVVAGTFLAARRISLGGVRPNGNQGGAWLSAVLAAIGAGILVGLKETGVGFLPALFLIAIGTIVLGPRRARRPSMFFASALVVIVLAFVVLLYRHPPSVGGYTSHYKPGDLASVLSMTEEFRRLLLKVYGPLPVLALSGIAIRVVAAVRRRQWDEDVLWRMAIAVAWLGSIAVAVPFQRPIKGLDGNAYYILPAVGLMAISLAWEATDIWSMLSSRTAVHEPDSNRSRRGVVAWLITSLALLAWIAPMGDRSSPLVAIVLKVGLTLTIPIFVVAARLIQIDHGVRVASSAHTTLRLVLCLSAVHVTLVGVPSLYFMTQESGTFFRSHVEGNAFAWLAQHAEPGSRVRFDTDWDAWNCQEIDLHFANCEHRPDLQVVGIEGGPAYPEDYVVRWSERPDDGPPFQPVSTQDAERFTGIATTFHPEAAQPARVTADWFNRWTGNGLARSTHRMVQEVEYRLEIFLPTDSLRPK